MIKPNHYNQDGGEAAESEAKLRFRLRSSSGTGSVDWWDASSAGGKGAIDDGGACGRVIRSADDATGRSENFGSTAPAP